MKGKVQTVLGEVSPSVLGRVLPHEHFEVDIENVFQKNPLGSSERGKSDFALNNLGWIRQFPYSHSLNMNLLGPEMGDIFDNELIKFKSLGGGTVVDNTIYGISGNSEKLEVARKRSQKTGVHIVCGTAFYVNASQSESSLALSEEDLSSILTKDIAEGNEKDPTLKCGMLGEIGCTWPLTDFERRSLRASAVVEESLGCPVMVHPGRNPGAPQEILRVFAEAGGNVGRLVMGHLDRTLHTNEDILEFASLGSLLEYDLFGIETSYYQQHEEIDMPSDAQRIRRMKLLIDEGYEDKLLMSHDIHTRHRLEEFGGHGFSHILSVVIPMMLTRGISQRTVDKIMIENPANWLTFTK